MALSKYAAKKRAGLCGYSYNKSSETWARGARANQRGVTRSTIDMDAYQLKLRSSVQKFHRFIEPKARWAVTGFFPWLGDTSNG